jgi:hypothetical protein
MLAERDPVHSTPAEENHARIVGRAGGQHGFDRSAHQESEDRRRAQRPLVARRTRSGRPMECPNITLIPKEGCTSILHDARGPKASPGRDGTEQQPPLLYLSHHEGQTMNRMSRSSSGVFSDLSSIVGPSGNQLAVRSSGRPGASPTGGRSRSLCCCLHSMIT